MRCPGPVTRGYAKDSYKGRGRREAAGEGTGDNSDGADDNVGDDINRHSCVGGNLAPNGAERNAAYAGAAGAAPHDRHSGVGRNPEGAGASPAPQNPADVPLDRHFIRF